ncbi:MAG TPA: type VII secretion integral membrane protein EccD [Pilimelia sp.]|nr:type VII secretion integral membrane protein EccD [Pilimelia sp.]
MSVDHSGRFGASTGLARVTVSAPQRRVDVALPEHVPLVELLPEVLRHAGEGLADDGERHGGWLLRRADGEVLAPAQGLFSQGVRDGEVLYLVPAQARWPELEFDDVVEAIAEGARRHGAVWTPAATRAASLAAAGVLLAVGLVALLRGGPGWAAAPYAGLGVAVLLTLAAVTASRAYGAGPAGATLGGYALPYAFVGGALLVATGDPVGVLAPVRWLGAPQLLVGSVALLLLAVLGLVGVAAGLRVFVAGVLVGLLGAVGAALGFLTSAAGAAAVLAAVLVCGIGVLPLLAIRFGKVPTPPVTLPTGAAATGFTAPAAPAPDAARERPDQEQVLAAVARTEQVLTGSLIGHALLSAACAVVLVVAGGTAGRLLAAATAAALLLRSRLFVTARQRVPLLLGGLAGFGALGVALAGRSGPDALLAVLLAAAAVALVVTVAGTTYATRPPSPYLGRTADLLDTVVMISVVPVACAVLDLYARVRGLAG